MIRSAGMDVLEREVFIAPKICSAFLHLLGSLRRDIEGHKETGRHRSKPAHEGFKDRHVARTHMKKPENRIREMLYRYVGLET